MRIRPYPSNYKAFLLKAAGMLAVLVSTVLQFSCSDKDTGGNEVFVTTDWLDGHRNDSSLVILTVGDRATYDSIHIPGARWMYLWDLVVDTDSLTNEVPAIGVIDSLLEDEGISEDSRIVLYYEGFKRIPRTCRVFMTLDYAGLGDRTSILSGGLGKWVDEGRETTAEPPSEQARGSLNLKENSTILTTAYDVQQFASDPDYVVLDARPGEFYTGEYDSILEMYTGGHIEGALNLPFEDFLNDTVPHLLKDRETIRELFAGLGADQGKTIVNYCTTGIWASVDYVMARWLGYSTLLYDGSFEDWEHLGLPVTKPVKDRTD